MKSRLSRQEYHHIEARRQLAVCDAEEATGSSNQAALLRRMYRSFRAAEPRLGARFDFDKGKRLSISSDNIDLPQTCPPVTYDDLVPAFTQEATCSLLRRATGVLLVVYPHLSYINLHVCRASTSGLSNCDAHLRDV